MAEKAPQVSIAIPVYNGERHLAEAIDSFLTQTFTDFELILSDNASTDATADICRECAARDPRVRYHRVAENQGAAWNFNHVFEMARGEYFKWAAHDDLCAPTYLEQCVDKLQANPSVVLCHSNVGFLDATGQPLDPIMLAEMSALTPESLADVQRSESIRNLAADEPHRRYRDVLLHTFWVFEIFGVIRTAALRETGLHRPYYGSDKTLLAELCLLGPFYRLPETLFFSRRHAEQSCALTSAQERESWLDAQATRCNAWSQMLRVARGHFSVIRRPEIGWIERLRCVGAAVEYTFQWAKWKRLLIEFWQERDQVSTATTGDIGRRI